MAMVGKLPGAGVLKTQRRAIVRTRDAIGSILVVNEGDSRWISTEVGLSLEQ